MVYAGPTFVEVTIKSLEKLRYIKSPHDVVIYNNVFRFPAMKIDSATTNENISIYSLVPYEDSNNYSVFTVSSGANDVIIKSDPISLTGSISISFEGSLPFNARAYIDVNDTLYEMNKIGYYYYNTVRNIQSSDTVKFVIKATAIDVDTKLFIRNVQIENNDEPTAYIPAGSSRDAGFLSYNFDPERIKALLFYAYTPESSNEKTLIYMEASNIYLCVKNNKLYLNGNEILDWPNDHWNIIYIDKNKISVNSNEYATSFEFKTDILYIGQKNNENHLNGFISVLTFLKKELTNPMKVLSSMYLK